MPLESTVYVFPMPRLPLPIEKKFNSTNIQNWFNNLKKKKKFKPIDIS